MNFADFTLRDLRLTLLKALAEQPSYTCNEVILQSVAQSFGHHRTRESIRTELNWLATVSAVTVRDVQGYAIATLTRRGLDHLGGLLTIDGVNRPSPKD
jgi:hypothetical protein